MQSPTQRAVSINGPHPEFDHEIWKPTAPSLGSRQPALRSRYSSIGFMVEDGRVLNFESRPERFAGEAFAMDPTIEFVLEQPPRVAYRDGGRGLHHTFDFYTKKVCGTRTFTAIKHSRRVERSGIRRTIKLIAEQIGRGLADEIALLTELDFSATERFNAELAHEIKRDPVPAHDEHVRQIAAELQGVVTVSDVVAISGLAAEGFRSIVRLIASRFFQLAHPDTRIDYGAHIRRCISPCPDKKAR
ncbi:hypothetical protein H8A97_03515 [Bradyrhizobium sp. Arg62]|uniref:hypothetical protein n=1 Tax=Bradyrhizobium brasilense TaxID=1419277 RepID=UPI001E2CBDAE|nr:hypothetical protein [Bradyrhizobium brasilense]MCC8944191.1 hypothetical protein [Bradyrhizobium brasilense]